MTKHWKTTAIKDGHLVNLFTFTTERGIAIDLAAGEFGSLILATRKSQPTPNHVNEYEDHLDLATGAFNQYAVRHGYEATSLYLVEVAGLPNSELKPHPVGGMKFGGSRLYPATVFEEAMDEISTWSETQRHAGLTRTRPLSLTNGK